MNFFLVTVPAIPTKLKINKEHPMATTVTHAFSNIDEAPWAVPRELSLGRMVFVLFTKLSSLAVAFPTSLDLFDIVIVVAP
jgi:hypothetical protein